MIKSTDLYINTGAIHTDPENDKYLYELQKNKSKGDEKNMFCRHEWIKVGGPQTAGPGRFSQHFRCVKCNKTKRMVD